MLGWLARKVASNLIRNPGSAPASQARLHEDPEGFSLGGKAVHWNEVQRITVFKRDVFAHDLLCLLIQSKSGVFELNEEMPGWGDFIKSIENRLPTATPYAEWFLKTIEKPFAPTPMDIYLANPS